MRVLVATNVAFAVVFGLFLVVLAFLIVWILVWAIRRDAKGRKRWIAEQTGRDESDPPS